MKAPEPLPRWPEAGAMKVVGHAHPRASACAKVTGAATFASDVRRPGMAHAVLLRSSIACGTVTRFDASRARALAGVLLVVGPFDGPWPAFPRRVRPSVDATVRFVGEEIGAIVAETEAIARQAAALVDIGYAAEPARITLAQALADPAWHDDQHLSTPPEVIERGDLVAAEAAADVIVESHWSTAAQHHNALEPHGCVAEWGDSGVTLWDSNQGGHLIREWLATAMGMPLETVRVISGYVGGGFGSKIHLKPYHVIAAELARRVARPVRLFMARREEFVASHQRAATQRRLRLGATRAGRLSFIDESVAGQAGPCRFMGINAAGAANGLRLHRVDAVRAELRRVLTNTQAPIPFRGPTAAEDLFCLEQAIDELAQALKMDPLQLRLRNLAEVDLLSGLPYAGKQLERCYRLGAEAFGWHFAPAAPPSEGRVRGIGMGAVAYDATLYEASRAEIARVADGRFELRLGITEIGCGADTVFAQIAAEVLDVQRGCIATHFGDTASTPRSIDASNHSRTSAVVGPAVRAAAQALRDAMREPGAPMRIVRSGERERAPEGVFAAMFGAHFVEVEVDLRSGQVHVLRAVCAHDAGRILNPRLAASQVHGGFLQGLGMALQEQRVLDPRSGQMLNAAMWAYRTPGILEAPGSLVFVDAGMPDGGNSLGVKGIGEPPLICAGAAIANAIHHATGVRLRDYPITPDTLLTALEDAKR